MSSFLGVKGYVVSTWSKDKALAQKFIEGLAGLCAALAAARDGLNVVTFSGRVPSFLNFSCWINRLWLRQ
jgi:hypothetical protein